MQLLVCDECGEEFDTPYLQVNRLHEEVQHIHLECMIWNDLGVWIKADTRDMNGLHIEIQVVVPYEYTQKIEQKRIIQQENDLGAYDMGPGV